MNVAAWTKATRDLPTKSAKIRALDALGVARADIARFLDIRYQHVRNVLTAERPAEPSPKSFAETAPAYDAHPESVRLHPDGSVTIPPAIAATLLAHPGDALVAIPTDGGLWIATRKASRESARRMVQAIIPGDADVMGILRQERQNQNDRLDSLSKPYAG
ncbi:MAG: hypothetical protein QM698_04845 [Micropepsaceae bacterium]